MYAEEENKIVTTNAERPLIVRNVFKTNAIPKA